MEWPVAATGVASAAGTKLPGMAGDPSSVLAALGLDRDAEQLYFRLVPVSGHTLVGVARLVEQPPEGLLRALAPLRERGLVALDGERLVVPPLAEVLSELVRKESQQAATSAARLGELARAVPHLVAAATRPDVADLTEIRPLDGELSSGGDPFELLQLMLRTSRGDMLWLRPDAWAMPRESRVSALLAEAMATGRRSRAIYPVRALTEAPDALRTRARLGEQVRVHVGAADQDVRPRRHPRRAPRAARVHRRAARPRAPALDRRCPHPVVRVCCGRSAAPVPELESGQGRPDERQFLLEQLMAGVTDEVIARKLGIGLRTVRRRIAALMTELGVDTRFQAGVEAVRRGWL